MKQKHLIFKENEHEKRKALLSDNDVFCRCKVAQYSINGETAHITLGCNSMATTFCWGSMSTASTSQLVAAAFVPNIENLASNSYDTKARNMFF